MKRIQEYKENEFLSNWIQGNISIKDLESFMTSELYKNLVNSREKNKTV
ncbi:hypothetical protein [Aquimarina algicola]|nr:hypothetical protein [Aquimarina algicola]